MLCITLPFLCSSHIPEDASLVSNANYLDMMRSNPDHSLLFPLSRAIDSTSEVAFDSSAIHRRASFALVRLYSHRWAPKEEAFYAVASSSLADSTPTRAHIPALLDVEDDVKIPRQAERIPIAPRHALKGSCRESGTQKKDGVWGSSRRATLFPSLVLPVTATFLDRQSIYDLANPTTQ